MSYLMTFRPTGLRIIAYALVVILVVITVVIGGALPEDYRFTRSQTITIWGMIAAVALMCHAAARSRVRANDDQIEVVNGFSKKIVSFDDIDSISMKSGAPWPTVVTRDGRRIILFAIQGTEGQGAMNAVRWLKGRLR